jgi:hypothetical protein
MNRRKDQGDSGRKPATGFYFWVLEKIFPTLSISMGGKDNRGSLAEVRGLAPRFHRSKATLAACNPGGRRHAGAAIPLRFSKTEFSAAIGACPYLTHRCGRERSSEPCHRGGNNVNRGTPRRDCRPVARGRNDRFRGCPGMKGRQLRATKLQQQARAGG